MKFPVDKKWRVVQDSDIGGSILATRNINFDTNGIAQLSEKIVALFTQDDDADIDAPIGLYHNGNEITTIITADEVFDVQLADESPTATQTAPAFGATPNPSSIDSASVYYNNELVLTQATDICTFSSGATSPWTDRTLSPPLTSGKAHPVAVNQAGNSTGPTLLIGNGNKVQHYNSSWVTSTLAQLTIPTEFEIVAIAYNRNLVGIATWSEINLESQFYIWDAAASSANYAYPIGSNRAYFVAPYKDTFVILTGQGQLLKWASSGMEQLGALPSFYTTGVLGDVDDTADTAHSSSFLVDGDVLLFNITGELAQKMTEKDQLLQTQPSGVWCYDPQVGLYHRYAPSSSKIVYNVFGTSVDTGTNVITLGASVCPETGTEAVYTSKDAVVGGLIDNTVYYVIKLTTSTLKLATTRTNALVGTAIDLTSTGHSSNTLQFLPAQDYGQHSSFAGLVRKIGTYIDHQVASSFIFGARSLGKLTSVNTTDTICVTSRFGDNRGWVLTQKLFSQGVTEHWSKLYVKARGLKKDGDEVVVKYRYQEDTNMPVYATITWTSQTEFTSTNDLSDVQVGYEIEVLRGAGSGYLAHVTDISENAGTYTVTIDETIRNIVATNTAYAVFDNWTKVPTTMTHTTNKDYLECPIGKTSKWIQFRFELRGKGVALEEYEIINSTNKASV